MSGQGTAATTEWELSGYDDLGNLIDTQPFSGPAHEWTSESQSAAALDVLRVFAATKSVHDFLIDHHPEASVRVSMGVRPLDQGGEAPNHEIPVRCRIEARLSITVELELKT